MSVYVVLLRGINVGRHNRIAMGDLRALLGDLGYRDAATHLQSGNAVVTSGEEGPEAVAAAVSAGLRERFGLEVPVVVRTAAGFAAAVEANPLEVADPSRFLVLFCSGTLDTAALVGLDPAAYPRERLAVTATEAYTVHEEGLRLARLPDVVARHADGAVTGRNWRTVLRIAEMTRR
ncbi:Uncharacterized conserved protein, DUF1697 family [Nocardiopsis flavescens]|uniref:Uncharacterized conserved protein, DUF1697 family n=1 Tax=Nocardiopsis flavescens TaxID=758803 RepID=A0A1M6Q3N0_9ACTN|nr:DUF1697 domain-containing protein [Nocardiopsis flavescens]SHK14835.1 Uncharacterized conserved protein, DUF1697 family [Nocardiopsis flavescens]